MCGIAGIIRKRKITNLDVSFVEKMIYKLSHRGPDDEGVKVGENFVFGHKRLSIIDIKFGKQPMTSDYFTITYNGELYNYLELRQELLRQGVDFNTFSDTEVVLKMVQHRGLDIFLSNAIGMFSFGIFDSKKRIFIAAVDHFGVKPLYYYFDGETLVFASEIKAILEYFKEMKIKQEVNFEAIHDYITFQFPVGEKTFFKGIKKLTPATYLIWDISSEPIIRKYWDMKYEIDSYHTEEYFIDSLLMMIKDSVHIHMRSDVPVGAHLSGGLDSSTISMLASEEYPGDFMLFHGRFPEYPKYDEYRYAKKVSEQIKNSKLIEVHIKPEQFIDYMPKILYFMDEPAGGPGLFAQFVLNSIIKDHVKVVLGGQGGDELFGGYIRYLIAYLEQCLKHAILETNEEGKYVVTFSSIIKSLPHLRNYIPTLRYFFKDGFFEDMERRYFHLVDRSEELLQFMNNDFRTEYEKEKNIRIYNEFHSIFAKEDTKSYFNKMTYFDMKTLLPALLHIEDRVSMAFSIESRVPLLNKKIAELVASCPPTIKFKNGQPKYLMKMAIKSIIPKEILERKDKMGFPVPLNEWVSENKNVKNFVFGVILESSFLKDIFDLNKIENILRSQNPFSRAVWGVMNLSLWADTFFK